MTLKQSIVRSRWWANRSGKYHRATLVCGARSWPGRGTDRPDLVDYSQVSTTPDQARIEDHLVAVADSTDSVLHVGVGNSSLAERLSGIVRQIDGISVSEAEVAKAQASGLANYHVVLANKHEVGFAAQLAGGYRYIVDNNLASFACCQFHLGAMIDGYAALLGDGGTILTDRRGMRWSAGDPRWIVTARDIADLFEPYGFAIAEIGDHLLALATTHR